MKSKSVSGMPLEGTFICFMNCVGAPKTSFEVSNLLDYINTEAEKNHTVYEANEIWTRSAGIFEK